MNEYYFTFRSMTRGQQAAILLLQHGIVGNLVRTPKVLTSKGCGYAIAINRADAYAAATILRQERIGFDRVFRLGAGLMPEEVAL